MGQRFMVSTAIDGAERLARMGENIKRAVPRLAPKPGRTDTLVVCGYGPSLRDTWYKIPDDALVCTVSGAHDFLIERGIVPRWHVEYDPRPHKCEFLKHPRNETCYCLASTCHEKMFEQLASSNVMLWHALGQDPKDDSALVAKHEHDGILLLGGSNAGSRAIMVGHVLGFRKFDLHGFDCGYLPNTIWAGPHSGDPHVAFDLECNGRKFLSSPAMVNSAEELWKMMQKTLAGCEFTVRGNGLLAERIRLAQVDKKKADGEWWTSKSDAVKKVAVSTVPQINALITESYREQNRIMHRFNPMYGNYGGRHVEAVKLLCEKLNSRDVLDYGCGKRALELALGFPIRNYDPAIPGLEQSAEPADIVVCADVLEHIEPNCIDAVMADLKRVVRKTLLVEVSIRPASKTLPDGRNAHLMIFDADWWLNRLGRLFTIANSETRDGALVALCKAV